LRPHARIRLRIDTAREWQRINHRVARQIDRDGFAALNALPAIADRRRIKEW
jgi:hypothetical protein